MSLRQVCALAIAVCVLAGCSKPNSASLSVSQTLPPPPAADVALVVPAEEGPIAGDPISDAAPLPIATSSSLDWMSATRIVEAAPEAEQTYLLDAGDRIRVFVYGQPNLSRIYPIDGQGFITMPLIGSVRARANTTYDLANVIASELRVSYVRDPEVTVEVAAYRPFFILGEVRLAGQYPYAAGLTVQAAVAIAGGFTPRAREDSIQITRVLNGEQEELDVPPNTRVRPGDSIYVRERWF